MSADAEQYVAAFTHPKVKESARALLEVIARLIPEGYTATPLIAMEEDLAVPAGLHRRTAWKWLGVLEEIGVLRIVDGGQGRPARYELVGLAGDRPLVEAPLPLVGAAAPRRSRPRVVVDPMPSLFDPPAGEDRAITLWQTITSTAQLVIDHMSGSITSAAQLVILVIDHMFRSITSTPQLVIDPGKTITSTPQLVIDHKFEVAPLGVPIPLDVGVDGTYNNLKETSTTTTTGASAEPAAGGRTGPARCRWHGTVHAWCDGRVHVPMGFHHEERRKLPRRPGETDADLDAQLFARYAERSPSAHEKIPDKNEFEYWKRVLRSPATKAPPGATRGPARSPIPDNELFARASAERRQRYGAG